MPRGKKRSAGKKATPVKTREAGINRMIKEDQSRKANSKAVKGKGQR